MRVDKSRVGTRLRVGEKAIVAEWPHGPLMQRNANEGGRRLRHLVI